MLLEIPEIAQAVVSTFEPEPGATELVAYYAVRHGAAAPDPAAIVAHMRARLPAYMTPAYLERLPFIPTLVSNKADRKLLAEAEVGASRGSPARSFRRRRRPRRRCARRFEDVLGLEAASIDADMFAEYGAHSLLMARFCARVRALEPSLQVAHARRLRQPDDPPARPRARRAKAAPRRRTSKSVRPTGRRTSPITPAARRRRRSTSSPARSRSPRDRPRSTGSTKRSTRRSRSTRARSPSPSSGSSATTRSPIAAKWLLVGRVRAGAIPLWSAALFPLLGGQAPRALGAGQRLRRNAALQRLSAPARREDRRATR